MLVIPENVKKRILSKIMDFIHAEDLKFSDDFPIKIANSYVSLIKEKSELPNPKSYFKKVNRIRTTFFRLNTGITKRGFLEDLLNELNREFEPILSEIEDHKSLKMLERPKILFLAANPEGTVRLRLDQEVRDIENKILLAQKKDQFILVNKSAVRIGDLQFHLNQEKPTIVHFSGHGTNEGRIILEDNLGSAKTVPPAALARVFEILKDNIRCVVLNACFSSEQARAISQHIDCVVGMSSSISDEAAIAFASAFYLAIASERSIKNAFDQGINEVMLWEIPEEHIPQLLVRDNVDPSKIFLLETA